VSGRFVSGGLFRTVYLADQSQNRLRLAGVGPRRIELDFPEGWPGPAELRWKDADGQSRQESWPALPPWEPLVALVEQNLGRLVDTAIRASATPKPPRPIPDAFSGDVESTSWTRTEPRLGWLDAIRAIELDDSVRRSLHYRRAYSLDLQEANEETTFKGTMTLVGCSLLWITILLLFLSIWMPRLGWIIFPAIAIFLILQLLRWVVPKRKQDSGDAKP
jgi:hypothetical protein